jgi:hypothetical protein
MKSLAMTYYQSKDTDPGNAQLLGALKIKGKRIDPNDLPVDLQVMWGIVVP